MQTLSVGSPYIIGKNEWPDGVAEYNYANDAHELRLFWSAPTDAEVAAVRQAPMHLALLVEDGIIFLVWRFEGIGDWSDCPFSIHLVPESHRRIPPIAEGEERALLQVVLVDASTGLVCALRAVTIPPLATQLLVNAIREQAQRPFARSAYDQMLRSAYDRYPDSRVMAQAATLLVKAGT